MFSKPASLQKPINIILGELYAPSQASPPLTLHTPLNRLKTPVKPISPTPYAWSLGNFILRQAPLLEQTKTPPVEQLILMTLGDSLSPASNTDSLAVNATAGGGDTRLVLVDSGANTLYAESKRNLTNIRAATIQITGVNGTSVAQRVGTLPPMVTNKGHPIILGQDCVISNDQDIQNTNAPRTIVTPKHLNENGISVYFANGTTVLLIADTVELKGSVIHQERFSEGLALINLYDHTGDKAPPQAKVVQPQLVNIIAPLRGRRGRLNMRAVAAAVSSNTMARIKQKPAVIPPNTAVVCSARSKFKMDKNSWERWHPKLGHSSLDAMRKALAQDPAVSKVLEKLSSTNCSCIPCLTTRVQSHPHNHGHAHLGGHDLLPGERMDCDNSGMFANSVNQKRYRFLAVEYITGTWFIYHAALKSEAPVFFTKTRSALKALSKRDLRFMRSDSDSLFSTSKEMQKLYTDANVIPSFSPPYDQSGNSVAENGIKWLNRMVKTVFEASGTPSYLWPEVDNYCGHHHNYLPFIKQEEGKFISRMAVLRAEPTFAHDMELFYPFGCLVIVMIANKQRKGPKHLDQEVGWSGTFVGYGLTTGHGSCLRVLNVTKRCIVTVSINFCTVIEDNFPFLLTYDNLVPISYQPTPAAYADQKEWALYNFTPEEEEEVIADLYRTSPKVWKSLFNPDPPIPPHAATRLPALSIDSQATPPPALEAMTPLSSQLTPQKRVELDQPTIDIDLSFDDDEDARPAPVADASQTTDTTNLTPFIQRNQHTPTRLVMRPRRSARLAETTPIPFTTFNEEDTPTEDIKDSGKESDTEHLPAYAVRGIKSVEIRLDVETGKNKYWYETEWEGYGQDHNTWQLACDFDQQPATKAMLRAARDGRDVSSMTAKKFELPNQIYSIHRKSRGYMAKLIDGKYTRTDLLFESVMNSIPDPLPAHCVSAISTADIAAEKLYVQKSVRRVNHLNPGSNSSQLTTALSQPLSTPISTVKPSVPKGRDRKVSWGPNCAKDFLSDDIVKCPPSLRPVKIWPIPPTIQIPYSSTPVIRGIGGVVLFNPKRTVTGSILSITKKQFPPRVRPPAKAKPPGRKAPPAKSLPLPGKEAPSPGKTKTKIDLGYRVLSEKEKEICKIRVQSKDPYSPPPNNRKEMLRDAFRDDYIRAEEDEITSLWGFETFTFVKRAGIPKQGKILRTKWVYSDKLEIDGKVDKLKARLTAMGCFQREGIDYHETFASVSRTQTLRVLMIIYNSDASFSCVHWDVKSAFVNAPIEEDIWIEQPDGHDVANFPRSTFVLKLRKALYGTKQAARAWQQFLKALLAECGATPLMFDDAVYKLTDSFGGWVLLGTHVDDLFGLCNPKGHVLRNQIRTTLSAHVTITGDGEIKWALKARIDRDAKAGLLKISQEVYIKTILMRFHSYGITEADSPAYAEGVNATMTEAECAATPFEVSALHEKYPYYEAIGCLWWAANISQPCIYPAVHRCAQYISCPSEKLWKMVLRIFGYLMKYPKDGLVFQRHQVSDTRFQQEIPVSGKPNTYVSLVPLLSGEVDSSLNDARKAKSTLGQLSFFMGNLMDWKSATSTRVAGSSAEAESMAFCNWLKENSWQRNLIQDIWDIEVNLPTKLLYSEHDFEIKRTPDSYTIVVGEDNAAVIAMSKGQQSSKTKYFDRDWYLAVDRIKRGEFELVKVDTKINRADMFTKSLPTPRFIELKDRLIGGPELQNHVFEDAKRVEINMFSRKPLTAKPTIVGGVDMGFTEDFLFDVDTSFSSLQMNSAVDNFTLLMTELAGHAASVKRQASVASDLIVGLSNQMAQAKATHVAAVRQMALIPVEQRISSHSEGCATAQGMADAMEANMSRLEHLSTFLGEANRLVGTSNKAFDAMVKQQGAIVELSSQLQVSKNTIVGPNPLQAELAKTLQTVDDLTKALKESTRNNALSAGTLSAYKIKVAKFVQGQRASLAALDEGDVPMQADPPPAKDATTASPSTTEPLPAGDNKAGVKGNEAESDLDGKHVSDSESEVEIRDTSKPLPAVSPPSGKLLDSYETVAELVMTTKAMVLSTAEILFLYPWFISDFGSPSVVKGITDKVLENIIGKVPNAFVAVPLHKAYGLLVLPDQPSDATQEYYTSLQQVYAYTKEQELQTVRLWLYTVLMHCFTGGRFVTVLDPAKQTVHALTCARYLTGFLDDEEGLRNRRDYELTYGTGDRLASTEYLCACCKPQYLLQALMCWASLPNSGDAYNANWKCLVGEAGFHRLQERPQPPGVFSQRFLERLVCRLPLRISQAILDVDADAFMGGNFADYLDAVEEKLRRLRYFHSTTATTAIAQLKQHFAKYLKTEAKFDRCAEILLEAKYLCAYCKIGLFSGNKIVGEAKCCNPDCLKARNEEEQAKQSLLAQNRRKTTKAMAVVAAPVVPTAQARVRPSRAGVKKEKKEKPADTAALQTRKQELRTIYGQLNFLQKDVRAAMTASLKETGIKLAYYTYHQNLLPERDREMKCFPARQQHAKGWFGTKYETPGVTWLIRSEFFHFIAPTLFQAAIKKFKWEENAQLGELRDSYRFPIVAVAMLEEVDPKLWQQFPLFLSCYHMFDNNIDKYFEIFVQFVLVSRTVRIISQVLEAEDEAPLFYVSLRNEVRVFVENQTVRYPMWLRQQSYNLWNEFLDGVKIRKFSKAHPDFVLKMIKAREPIYVALNTYPPQELKAIRSLIDQMETMQSGVAQTGTVRLQRIFFGLLGANDDESKAGGTCDGSDSQEEQSLFTLAKVATQDREDAVDPPPGQDSNDSHSSKAGKSQDGNDSRRGQIATATTQVAQTKRQGQQAAKNVGKSTLRSSSDPVADALESDNDLSLPQSPSNQGSGFSLLGAPDKETAGGPPANPKSAVLPSPQGFALPQSSDSPVTSPFLKMMVSTEHPEQPHKSSQKRPKQHNPSLEEPDPKMLKQAKTTPAEKPPSRQRSSLPTPNDLAKLQRSSPPAEATRAVPKIPTPVPKTTPRPQSTKKSGDVVTSQPSSSGEDEESTEGSDSDFSEGAPARTRRQAAVNSRVAGRRTGRPTRTVVEVDEDAQQTLQPPDSDEDSPSRQPRTRRPQRRTPERKARKPAP